MPAKKTAATVEHLRRLVADAEAKLGALRAKLAKAEAKEGAAEVEAPACGLDLLWSAALPMSRQRSSKHRCRVAWARLPKAERPPLALAVAALHMWNRCDQWRSNDNLYAPGLHRFIAERMWECLPENTKGDPMARYRRTPAAMPENDPADAVTDRSEIARLLSLKVTSHES